jgi:hypothetical protein
LKPVCWKLLCSQSCIWESAIDLLWRKIWLFVPSLTGPKLAPGIGSC